jgi:hypothetical protein
MYDVDDCIDNEIMATRFLGSLCVLLFGEMARGALGPPFVIIFTVEILENCKLCLDYGHWHPTHRLRLSSVPAQTTSSPSGSDVSNLFDGCAFLLVAAVRRHSNGHCDCNNSIGEGCVCGTDFES